MSEEKEAAPEPVKNSEAGVVTDPSQFSTPGAGRATPDYAKSLEFLRLLSSEGPWTIYKILPKRSERDKSAPRGAQFLPDQEAELRAWLAREGEKHSVYFSPNPLLRVPEKDKAKKSDVKAVAWLHVDVDPRAGEDLREEQQRIRRLFDENLPAGVPPPTLVMFSGGGYQALWKLREPVPIEGDVAKAEAAECYTRALELAFGADSTHNVDRILRLPGTVNRPDYKKRAKGRSEALAALELFEVDRVYDLAQFPAAAPKGEASGRAGRVSISDDVVRLASVDDLPVKVPERVRLIIAHGRHPTEGPKPRDDSRSAWLYDAVCSLLRADCNHQLVYSVITDPRFPISASVLDKGSRAKAYAKRQIERALDEVEDFAKDDGGKPRKTLRNIRKAVTKLGVLLEYDEFANQTLLSGLEDFGPGLDDAGINRLWLSVEDEFGLQVAKERFWAIVQDMALNQRRHPVREYLDGLAWDGTARIDTWLVDFLGAEDSPFVRAVGAITLMAAVRRVRSPGCKFDEMLVLEGLRQGKGKSELLACLAVRQQWFSDDLPLNAGAREFIEATIGKWIVEAGELKGMRKSDVESLKSCLSRGVDRSRMAFGRLPLERPRQFVIIGTTNSDRYLRDNTGNRRFWPVRTGEVDLDGLRRSRDQLWAEAAQREADGESIRLDRKLYAAAAEEQEARRVEDPFVQRLADALGEMEGKLRAEDAWKIVGVLAGQRSPEHNTRLGDAMRELGWTRSKLRFGGAPDWCYVKGDGRRRILVSQSDLGEAKALYEEERQF